MLNINDELNELILESKIKYEETATISGERLRSLRTELDDAEKEIKESIKDLKIIEKQIPANFKVDTYGDKLKIKNGINAPEKALRLHKQLSRDAFEIYSEIKIYKKIVKHQCITKIDYEKIKKFIKVSKMVSVYVRMLDNATNSSWSNFNFKLQSDILDLEDKIQDIKRKIFRV